MKTKLIEAKQHIYRATSVLFLFQLFGAFGAGLLFIPGNLLGIEFLKAGQPISAALWHIFFWSADFLCIALVALLSYYIAGLPALPPALTLGVYFAHFGGQYSGSVFEPPLYNTFFASPQSGGGGLNIGYMGYLIMAVLLGYLIKSLVGGWDRFKISFGPKLDGPIAAVKKKVKPLQGLSLDGTSLLELLDLVAFILVIPIAAAVITYYLIYYGVFATFNGLGNTLEPILIQAYESSNALGGLLSGAMVGFDSIGPISKTAFRVASNFAAAGNAVPMTTYALCFATIGWVPLTAFIINKISRKGGPLDADDTNLSVSGPINAFFDNMRLTVSFSMTFAMRDPIRVIAAYICSGSITGLLASAFSLANKNYVTSEFVQKFLAGETYVSFTQPLRSISATSKGLLLPVCGALGAIVGGCLMVFLKELAHQKRLRNNIIFEPQTDVVSEIRRLSQKFNKKKQVIIQDNEEAADTQDAKEDAKTNI